VDWSAKGIAAAGVGSGGAGPRPALAVGDVRGLELRIDRHPIAIFQLSIEADRLAIDQHQFDFGVRHAQCFDHVLGGGSLRPPDDGG